MQTISTATPVWFITGASGGLGEALTRHALDRGYRVVATARDLAKLGSLAEIAPDRLLMHLLDVNRPGDAVTAVTATVARFGPSTC